MRHIFDQRSIDLIQKGLEDGRVDLVDSETYLDFLGMLPNNGYRLRWENIKNQSVHPPEGIGGSKALSEIAYQDEVRRFVEIIGNQYSLKEQACVLVEDHYSDCALAMKFHMMNSLVEDFIYSPGHKYIFSTDQTWLLNITMEGDVYFSPNCLK